MTTVNAYAASAAGEKLHPFTYELGELGVDEIEIDVEYCGICHSDLSMLKNDWGMTTYPFVPGHEVIGIVKKVGENVHHVTTGQKVGVGRVARSCLHCDQCVDGSQNLCGAQQGIIVGRHGGFADSVRVQGLRAFPLPNEVDSKSAGPLFCGGATVFTPFLVNNIQPTQKVGVVGIGGLGHMAIMFANARGCEVTAFSSTKDKEKEAKELGAHHFVATKETSLESIETEFDMILSTVNVPLDWNAYINLLAPKGKLHSVGAQGDMSVNGFGMIVGQKSVGGSPVGSVPTIRKMVEFVARHNIRPMIEMFPLSKVNEAMERLEHGKPRYRIVLDCKK